MEKNEAEVVLLYSGGGGRCGGRRRLEAVVHDDDDSERSDDDDEPRVVCRAAAAPPLDNVVQHVMTVLEQLRRISDGDYLTRRARERWRDDQPAPSLTPPASSAAPCRALQPVAGARSELDVRTLRRVVKARLVLRVPRPPPGPLVPPRWLLSYNKESASLLCCERRGTASLLSLPMSTPVLPPTKKVPLPIEESGDAVAVIGCEVVEESTLKETNKKTPGEEHNSTGSKQEMDQSERSQSLYESVLDFSTKSNQDEKTFCEKQECSSCAVPLEKNSESVLNLANVPVQPVDDEIQQVPVLDSQSTVSKINGCENEDRSPSVIVKQSSDSLVSKVKPNRVPWDDERHRGAGESGKSPPGKEKREKKKQTPESGKKMMVHKYGRGHGVLAHPTNSVTKLPITNKSFYNSIYGPNELDPRSAGKLTIGSENNDSSLLQRLILRFQDYDILAEHTDDGASPMTTPETRSPERERSRENRAVGPGREPGSRAALRCRRSIDKLYELMKNVGPRDSPAGDNAKTRKGRNSAREDKEGFLDIAKEAGKEISRIGGKENIKTSGKVGAGESQRGPSLSRLEALSQPRAGRPTSNPARPAPRARPPSEIARAVASPSRNETVNKTGSHRVRIIESKSTASTVHEPKMIRESRQRYPKHEQRKLVLNTKNEVTVKTMFKTSNELTVKSDLRLNRDSQRSFVAMTPRRENKLNPRVTNKSQSSDTSNSTQYNRMPATSPKTASKGKSPLLRKQNNSSVLNSSHSDLKPAMRLDVQMTSNKIYDEKLKYNIEKIQDIPFLQKIKPDIEFLLKENKTRKKLQMSENLQSEDTSHKNRIIDLNSLLKEPVIPTTQSYIVIAPSNIENAENQRQLISDSDGKANEQNVLEVINSFKETSAKTSSPPSAVLLRDEIEKCAFVNEQSDKDLKIDHISISTPSSFKKQPVIPENEPSYDHNNFVTDLINEQDYENDIALSQNGNNSENSGQMVLEPDWVSECDPLQTSYDKFIRANINDSCLEIANVCNKENYTDNSKQNTALSCAIKVDLTNNLMYSIPDSDRTYQKNLNFEESVTKIDDSDYNEKSNASKIVEVVYNKNNFTITNNEKELDPPILLCSHLADVNWSEPSKCEHSPLDQAAPSSVDIRRNNSVSSDMCREDKCWTQRSSATAVLPRDSRRHSDSLDYLLGLLNEIQKITSCQNNLLSGSASSLLCGVNSVTVSSSSAGKGENLIETGGTYRVAQDSYGEYPASKNVVNEESSVHPVSTSSFETALNDKVSLVVVVGCPRPPPPPAPPDAAAIVTQNNSVTPYLPKIDLDDIAVLNAETEMCTDNMQTCHIMDYDLAKKPAAVINTKSVLESSHLIKAKGEKRPTSVCKKNILLRPVPAVKMIPQPDAMIKVKRDILVTVYSILVFTVFAALSFPNVIQVTS